jgi:hypothetical protein
MKNEAAGGHLSDTIKTDAEFKGTEEVKAMKRAITNVYSRGTFNP